MVERLVANEKVEGSTPFARSIKNIVIKSKIITSLFQKFLIKSDIRIHKKKIYYYFLFRIIKHFLYQDIIINIYNFKILASIKKNKTSYFLLKKCEFGDYEELKIIKKFSELGKVFLLDVGANYGFYSIYTASLSNLNMVIGVEASKKTYNDFLQNIKINSLKNIFAINKAISNLRNQELIFNESDNDWESSLSHKNFKVNNYQKILSVKIDDVLEKYNLNDYFLLIKLDIEGNEIKALEGARDIIHKYSPIIIIEISKYIFSIKDNVNLFKNFLEVNNYLIFDTNKKEKKLNELLNQLDRLEKGYKTIGNFFLIKNSTDVLKIFREND